MDLAAQIARALYEPVCQPRGLHLARMTSVTPDACIGSKIPVGTPSNKISANEKSTSAVNAAMARQAVSKKG